jgi:hypothetical protein
MRRTRDPAAHGRAIAAVLAGAWRSCPPPSDGFPDPSLVPLLAAGGAAGLVRHRLGATPFAGPAGRELKQHYRLLVLEAVRREDAVRELLPRLRAAGVEPIVIKGWSSARLYPEPCLRPSGDLDLCVRAEDLGRAAATLAGAPLPCPVDLHADLPDLEDRSWSQVFCRSRLVGLGDLPVRVLGPEDHLRLLCLHLARHGMSRPLWLCDIALGLEVRPADFDWDCWRWGKEPLTAWAVGVVELACRLLGARAGDASRWFRGVPSWVEREVLNCWGAGRLLHGSRSIKAAVRLGLGPHHALPLVFTRCTDFLRRKVPHVLERLLVPHHRIARPFTIHRH